MKYIIMCGGEYPAFETPRPLLEICGETLVERTIRLLKETGVTDIAISSENPVFEKYAPVLRHDNHYVSISHTEEKGAWYNCFYPTDEPACYIFGDVFFSPQAIRTIVGYETDDIMLFGSKAPFSKVYPKPYREPFAFKVQNQRHLHEALEEVRRLDNLKVFFRFPIAWEVWSVIRGIDPNRIDKRYVAVNDYTCDIDSPQEAEKLDKHYRSILE